MSLSEMIYSKTQLLKLSLHGTSLPENSSEIETSSIVLSDNNS